MGWLAKPRKHEGSLVVEFTNPIVANNAIHGDTIWQSRIHTNRPYTKEGRCKMCKKCQKYGHVQAQCPVPKYSCGICAEEHPTWECPSKQDQEIQPKCANCKGPHKAASASCPVRKVHLDRAKRAVDNVQTHRVPQHLQTKAIQQTIDPTPQEAAQMPKKRGKAAANTAPNAPPKAPTKRAPKQAKATPQDAQPATNKAQNETVPTTTGTASEPVTELTIEPVTQSRAQSIAQSVAQPLAQPDIDTAPKDSTTTRPSTPEARNTSTPTAPTAVRIVHKEVPTVPQAEKRGRGRPPKSKSSSNDEQQQQAPISSIESAIASTESALASTQTETSADPLAPNQIHIPTYNDNFELQSPPMPNRHTPPLRRTPPSRRTPVGRSRRPVRNPVRNPVVSQYATRGAEKRRRELSQESDGAPLPDRPTISASIEGGNIILSSSASFRELGSQALSSDVNRLLNDFTESSQRVRERQTRQHALPIMEENEDGSSTPNSTSTRSSPDKLINEYIRDFTI